MRNNKNICEGTFDNTTSFFLHFDKFMLVENFIIY